MQNLTSRDLKRTEIRNVILGAGAEVVGKEGYAAASISRITQAAGIAHGTFYNYFSSQQDFFDELVPHLGEKMLQKIREDIRDGKDFWLREEIGFRAFFAFLQEHPHFYRVLNEAETHAPTGYQRHIKRMAARYVKTLRRAMEEGYLRPLGEAETEALVYSLMAARNYLCMRYALDGPVPEYVIQTYMSLVRQGIANSNPESLDSPAHTTATETKTTARECEIRNLRKVAGAVTLQTAHYEAALTRPLAAGDLRQQIAVLVDLALELHALEGGEGTPQVAQMSLQPSQLPAKAFSKIALTVSHSMPQIWGLHAQILTEEGLVLSGQCSLVAPQ